MWPDNTTVWLCSVISHTSQEHWPATSSHIAPAHASVVPVVHITMAQSSQSFSCPLNVSSNMKVKSTSAFPKTSFLIMPYDWFPFMPHLRAPYLSSTLISIAVAPWWLVVAKMKQNNDVYVEPVVHLWADAISMYRVTQSKGFIWSFICPWFTSWEDMGPNKYMKVLYLEPAYM